MRLLQFGTRSAAGRRRHLGALIDGTVDGGMVIDLSAAARAVLAGDGVSRTGVRVLSGALAPADMLAFIQAGGPALDLAERAIAHAGESGDERDGWGCPLRWAAEEVTMLPPITQPPMLRDFMAFERHLRNVFPRLGREIPDEWHRRPVYYKGNTGSIGAHGDDIAFPSYAERLDLEFEFAAVLGRDGTDIPEHAAAGYVFGYTVYNDFSERDIQAKEMSVGLGPAKGKDFRRGHVLGPVIVTADEIPDPYALSMTAAVNGETWTDRSSSEMTWRFEQMISYASTSEPLRAGEVIGSGTVGDGSGAEQDRWLEPGDVVELTVERIGTLRNRVVAASEAAEEEWYE